MFGAALNPLLSLANALVHVREQVALLRREPCGVEGQRLEGARTAHGPHTARGTTPRATCLVSSPLLEGGRTDVPVDACLGRNTCDLTRVACCWAQPCSRLQRPWRICQAEIWHWTAILRCLERPPQPGNPAVPDDHLARGHVWWLRRENFDVVRTQSYTPSDTRAARALCCDDVRVERAPLVRGVHEGPWSTLGVHVAHFCPMCLTARNSVRHPKSPVMSRTCPTRFDA